MSSDLIHLRGSTYLVPGPTNLGIVVDDGRVTLIDSGNDKESGRKINKILKEQGWTLHTIINTHSNADHIGGNDYLQRMTHCAIWAPPLESVFIEHPELEGSLLWGGYPVKEMRSKFFMAKPSAVTRKLAIQDEDREGSCRLYNLPGHYFDMVGILTADKVFFLGDCMFGETILSKYKIPFVYDVAAFKATIGKVRTIEADNYVLSHGPMVQKIDSLAEFNEAVIREVEDCLQRLLAKEMSYDHILKKVCDHFEIVLDCGQYALVGSTIRSFLSYLYHEGRLGYRFVDNMMYWSTLQ